jgi:hypothetical protein
MLHKLKASKTEAGPVSEMCRFYLEYFTLCATVCLCVFCIGILAPLRVVSSCVTNNLCFLDFLCVVISAVAESFIAT